MAKIDVLDSLLKAHPSILLLCLGLISLGATLWTINRTRKSEKERQQFERLIKISEFRQAWINNLRESLADYHSIGITPEPQPGQENNPVFNKELYKIGTRIELLMNPDDEDFKELQNILYQYLENAAEELGEVSTEQQGKIQSRFGPNAKFVEVSQRILKREWERLKQDLKEPQNL